MNITLQVGHAPLRALRMTSLHRILDCLAALAIAAISLGWGGDAPAQTATPCVAMIFEGAAYTVCTFDAGHDALQMFWKGADGKPYGAFAPLAAALNAAGRELRFAMNAGIYETDTSPVGLYIENSKRLRKLNLRDGDSNFYLKPNGVFFIGDSSVGVMESGKFAASAGVGRQTRPSMSMFPLSPAFCIHVRRSAGSASSSA